MGGTESQGISRTGQTVLARLMESQIWHPPDGSVALWGKGLRIVTMASAHLSVWEKAVPPALALMPDTSVSPYMPLVPFKLLPRCWNSEGVSLNKSMCGFFKGNCLGTPEVSSTNSIPVRFCSQKLWGLIFWHWNPGLGGIVWGRDSS